MHEVYFKSVVCLVKNNFIKLLSVTLYMSVLYLTNQFSKKVVSYAILKLD